MLCSRETRKSQSAARAVRASSLTFLNFEWSSQEQRAASEFRAEAKRGGKHRKVNLQPYLGRGPSVSSEVDILLLFYRHVLCAPRFSRKQNKTKQKTPKTPRSWFLLRPLSKLSAETNTAVTPTEQVGGTFRPSSSTSAV